MTLLVTMDKMGGHPGAAHIRGSSNVLRGGLDALDIAVSEAQDGRPGCQANVDGFCSGRKKCCRGMNCESNNCKANTTPSSSTTSSPTMNPTSSPSDSPTPIPTSNPTASPSDSPTLSPTPNPTASPSDSPTLSPTPNPTANPTASPSDSPTSSPTPNPTANPTASPSDSPTSSPTPNPTVNPTASPSDSPTSSPTSSPTFGTTSSPTSLFCAITQEYSDGTSGDWELTSFLGGTDPSQVTTLENLDQFVIPADEFVNVVGTLVVYAKAIIINGTLDGSGGGSAGAPVSYTDPYDYAPDGEQPACDLDENGECKTDSTIDGNGKGGFFFCESALSNLIPEENVQTNSFISPQIQCSLLLAMEEEVLVMEELVVKEGLWILVLGEEPYYIRGSSPLPPEIQSRVQKILTIRRVTSTAIYFAGPRPDRHLALYQIPTISSIRLSQLAKLLCIRSSYL
eukprot:scaffold36549_cov49-Cyclotella_meneghiniana.AAC.3